ncbi:hypothetical protein [Hoeflea poritis]|uniref:Lipoprotein n=1 Tax=Hoeflea poritis TaxID=2993659 RepID=A0ABT4VKS7_9HYPH|nr:hypothetical protein [Hoeflea poritis]MDA4844755.1 hypothetical protein [Hoeflea poritis]
MRIALAAIGATAILSGCGDNAPYSCDNRYINSMAVVKIQDLVKMNLKAPSTAKFPGMKVERIGDCVWGATSYVDSQNGFGATIRTGFFATVIMDEENQKWVPGKVVWR